MFFLSSVSCGAGVCGFLAGDAFALQKAVPGVAQQEAAGGGLIDALLSGAPFTGLTTGDYAFLGVVFGIGVYLLMRSRTRNDERNHHDSQDIPRSEDDVPGPGRDSEAYRRAQQTWDYLGSSPGKDKEAHSSERPPAPPTGDTEEGAGLGPDLSRNLPPTPASSAVGFDTTDLLQGAKVVYARMHESIALSDWEDVEQFTTPALFKSLKSRVAQKRNPPQVLFVEAGIEKGGTQGGVSYADVVFASLMQFEGAAPPQEVRELWKFVKNSNDPQSTWRIDAMQRISQ